jgi:hypothetical protein
MMQPGRANVGAAVVAHGAEHPRLHIAKGHAVGEAADVQFGVVITVRIAANDKRMFSAVTSHVGQRHGLVVKHQVRDCPGHSTSSCRTERVSKSSYSLGLKIRAQRVFNFEHRNGTCLRVARESGWFMREVCHDRE